MCHKIFVLIILIVLFLLTSCAQDPITIHRALPEDDPLASRLPLPPRSKVRLLAIPRNPEESWFVGASYYFCNAIDNTTPFCPVGATTIPGPNAFLNGTIIYNSVYASLVMNYANFFTNTDKNYRTFVPSMMDAQGNLNIDLGAFTFQGVTDTVAYCGDITNCKAAALYFFFFGQEYNSLATGLKNPGPECSGLFQSSALCAIPILATSPLNLSFFVSALKASELPMTSTAQMLYWADLSAKPVGASYSLADFVTARSEVSPTPKSLSLSANFGPAMTALLSTAKTMPGLLAALSSGTAVIALAQLESIPLFPIP